MAKRSRSEGSKVEDKVAFESLADASRQPGSGTMFEESVLKAPAGESESE